jgi:6-phosphogluconolactonase
MLINQSIEEITHVVCERILTLAAQAIHERGQFKLVLAGGKTPEKVYSLLAKSDADWSKWVIYHGDERTLPVDHTDRNSVMAANAWLNHVAIPKSQIFDMPTELGTKESARLYREVIKNAMPFDLVLLGMGEDGHIASLFPDVLHDESELIHEIYHSPKPPAERITLSANTLSATHTLLFLITGENKKEAFTRWQAGEKLPVATVSAIDTLDVYLDNSILEA